MIFTNFGANVLEVILLILCFFMCWSLRAHPVLMSLMILRVAATPLIHYFCHYVVYAETQGLDKVFNDEILYYRLAHAQPKGINLTEVLKSGGSSIYFGLFLNFMNSYSFDILIFVRTLNLFCFILIVILSHKMGLRMKFSRRSIRILLTLLILSPTLNYFSTKISRDMIIACMMLITSYYLIESKKIMFVLSAIAMIFLRVHLAASIFFSIFLLFLKRGLTLTLLISFAVLAFMSIANIRYFSTFLVDDLNFIYNYFINIMGLNFIFGDESLMALPKYEVIARRIFAFDTFIPQVLLFFILFFKNVKISSLTRFYIALNIPYLYLYQKAEFTAARQTILPFLPLIYLQIIYYVTSLSSQRRATSQPGLISLPFYPASAGRSAVPESN